MKGCELMEYIIGVDCGGTKTEAAAYDTFGNLLVSNTAGVGNVVVDYDKGLQNIKKAIFSVVNQLKSDTCLRMTIGIAGIDSGGLRESITSDLSDIKSPITLLNDGQLAHYSILKGCEGMTLTAGTGSVVLGLRENQFYRVGGWGHLLGDQGSAFDIAKQGIQQVLLEEDSGLEYSSLSESILAFFEVHNALMLTKKVYQLDKGEIAAVAVVIAERAEKDQLAKDIINRVGISLGCLLDRMINRLPKNESVQLIGLNGSVVEKNNQILSVITKYLEERKHVVKLIKKEESCTKGAYYLYRREQLS